MSEFNILDHLDALEPDGGRNDPRGDNSFHCPACGADNFKVNISVGKWNNFGCECSKVEIRNAISPAVRQSVPTTKAIRLQQHRSWDYFTAKTLERNQPALTVHRTDDGNGKRKIWQESLIDGHGAAEVKDRCLPYGLPEAKQALADGTPYIFWVEGEPCVDALRALGLFAITSIGGAGKFKQERDAGHIPPDRLVVVPDRDKPGLAHAEAVAAAHPGCQWLFPFPGTPEWNGKMPTNHGLDIADWIQTGATAEHIFSGIGSKPVAEPEGVAHGDIRDQFLLDAKSLKARLDRGLDQIDAISDVATRSVALITLRSELGLGKPEFELLIRQLSEAKAPKAEESFDDLMLKTIKTSHHWLMISSLLVWS